MFRRQLICPGCGDDWPSPPARFCGTCGGPLEVDAHPRQAAARNRQGPTGWPAFRSFGARRLAVVTTATVVIAAIAAATIHGVEFDLPRDESSSVELPDALGSAGQLSDEQREALAGFDPDRLSCDPAGCEAWRLRFSDVPTSLSVRHGWLAAIDGTLLYLRRLAEDPEVADFSEATRRQRMSTNEPTGGPSWGPAPTSPPPSSPTDGEHVHDLSGRFPALEWHDAHDGSGYLDVAATPPEQLTVLPDGAVVLRWFDRLVLLTLDGHVQWELASDERTFRYVDVVDDRLLVLRDDLPWPPGTTGPRPTGDPILASVHDLHDGRERWQRYTVSPRDAMDDGMLITTPDGDVEMVDLADGTTRWQRPLRSGERIQSAVGPWVVVTNAEGATLLDAGTGGEVAMREGSALLTPPQRIGEVWVAAWLDDGLSGGAASAAVIALDDDGQQRWRATIVGLGGGACCPAVIPWMEGTIAVHDPASPVTPWRVLDLHTGAAVDLPAELQPQLPLASTASGRIFVSSLALDRLVQQQQDRVGLLSADGHVRVHGSNDLEVVALDPFVVGQGNEVLGVRPVRSPPPD